ncbi:response regulator transcription factor [Sphingomonas morindae]|uniref:Response regulator n=1 Tax=Sphingomonas morindae TaxID=1541170 RepID=A0ABY4X497_9SPHN|nr:response regulator [Sphingomonas morindae]USI71709.1 response regulator [Sphingomonas morindae]
MSHFVHIVDDDAAVRTSLYTLLSTRSDLLLRSFRSGDDFLASLPELEGGVVLLDIHMPGTSGLDVLRLLQKHDVPFASVIITGQGDIQIAVQAMKLGAIDFVEKPYDHDALFAALDSGITRLDRDAAAAERTRSAKALIDALSEREREVLHQLLEGRANKQIAYALDVSPRTVEVHRANLMAKLRARSLPEAVRLAFAAGIVGSD